MRLEVANFSLRLRHPFGISRGTRTVQETVIVTLEEAGLRGFGEATANDYYGTTVRTIRRSVEAARPLLEASSAQDPAALWPAVLDAARGDRFAACAVDVALWDLAARREGVPLRTLWGIPPGPEPASSYTIGLAPIPDMVAKLRERPDWPAYKIKLGGPEDLDVVRALRAETEAPFRVDANGGWTASDAPALIEALAELGVEMVEQPLAAGDLEGMTELRARSPLPLFADESCRSGDDVERCAPFFHGVNLKLMKCGGATPALEMIAEARRLGLAVMMGCMTESTVGISAVAQFLPLLDLVDMDGAELLADDLAQGVRMHEGRALLPDGPGTGATLLEAR